MTIVVATSPPYEGNRPVAPTPIPSTAMESADSRCSFIYSNTKTTKSVKKPGNFTYGLDDAHLASVEQGHIYREIVEKRTPRLQSRSGGYGEYHQIKVHGILFHAFHGCLYGLIYDRPAVGFKGLNRRLCN